MIIKQKELRNFLQTKKSEIFSCLIYGSNQGLIHETSQIIINEILKDDKNDFNYLELDQKKIRDEKDYMIDEYNSRSMIGDKRILFLRESADKNTKHVKETLKNNNKDTCLILESGQLNKNSSLRIFYEKSSSLVIIPCYDDDKNTIGQIVEGILHEEDLKIDNDAKKYLLDILGNDRQIAKKEIEKLVLYAGGDKKNFSLLDIENIINDSKKVTLDSISKIVLTGDSDTLNLDLEKMYGSGSTAIAILRSIARNTERLHLVKGLIEDGYTTSKAMSNLYPPVFWKDKDNFYLQIKKWSYKNLSSALEILTKAEIMCKKNYLSENIICSQALLKISSLAR